MQPNKKKALPFCAGILATDTIKEEVEETRTNPTFVLGTVLNLGETLDDTVDLTGQNFILEQMLSFYLYFLNISLKYKMLTEIVNKNAWAN